MINDLSPELRAAVRTLLDCFSGANADCIEFFKLLQEMDEKMKGGDPAATEVCTRVVSVARLIRYANGRPPDGSEDPNPEGSVPW